MNHWACNLTVEDKQIRANTGCLVLHHFYANQFMMQLQMDFIVCNVAELQQIFENTAMFDYCIGDPS
jgi:hypothetical protein